MSTYKFSRDPIDVDYISTSNRIIKTAIPCPGTKEILEEVEKFESRSMQGQMPIVWDSAVNFSVTDKLGNKWIDFTSTIFVANVGHANAAVSKAAMSVLEKPLLHSYAYINEERSNYLKQLVGFAGHPFEKAFLMSAGTEATEAALKLMRLNSAKVGKRKPGIICIDGNWHGRTMGAQMMSGNVAQKAWVGYHDPNIYHIAFPYPWEVEEGQGAEFLDKELRKLESTGVDISRDICGVMLEAFQGWGAVFYPTEFVQAVEKVCRHHEILLTFDEMQSGFARTGTKFGYEHYGVVPDLLCCGKGISSGFPLSAVIGAKHIMDLPDVGNMSSTHSANPMACVVGSATLDEIERLDLVNESARKGRLMLKLLDDIKQRHPDRISRVLGHGLLAAVHFKDKSDDPDGYFPSAVCEKAMQRGLLLVHTGRESIKIGPPLTISDDALIEGIGVLSDIIDELVKKGL